MRTLPFGLLLAADLLLASPANAQLTLEHVETGSWLMPAELENNGLKYIRYEIVNDAFVGLTDSLRLYNADYTPWRTIALPDGAVPCAGQGIQGLNLFYLSDALFDTDPSDVEFMVLFLCIGNSAGVGVYNEDGTPLLEESYAATWEYFSSYKYYSIYNSSDGVKLNLITYDPNAPNNVITGTKIWSLPGTFITQVAPNAPPADLLVAYPNPSSGALHVRAPEAFTIEVTDLQGRLVQGPTRAGQDRTALQLSGDEGVYLLHVRDANGMLLGVRQVVLSR